MNRIFLKARYAYCMDHNIKLDHIEQLMNRLHIKEADAALRTVHEDSWRTYMNKGRAALALTRLEDARLQYQMAFELAQSPLERNQAAARWMHIETLMGHLPEARLLMEQINRNLQSPWFAELGLYSALLDLEESKLDDAMQMTSQLLECDRISVVEKTDAENLMGDLLCFQGQPVLALNWYKKALNTSRGLPENWRDLRTAMIFNSMADTYGQMEDYEQVFVCYDKAWEYISKVTDPEVLDIDADRLEILISKADCLIQQEEYEAARSLIEHTTPLFERLRPSQKLYWQSRISYLKGLSLLYEASGDPLPDLLDAFEKQIIYLKQTRVSSRDYLGKISYYAVFCMDDESLLPFSQKELYELALEIFRQYEKRDEKFYSHSIAAIENELGTLTLKEDIDEALRLYEKSISDFSQYLKKYPDESFSRMSLVSVLINWLTYTTLPVNSSQVISLAKQAEEEIEILEKDPDMYEDALFFNNRLQSLLMGKGIFSNDIRDGWLV